MTSEAVTTEDLITVQVFAEQVTAVIPDFWEFTEDDNEQAISLIMACALACDDEATGTPKLHISELKNGLGCWMDGVEEGLSIYFTQNPDTLNEQMQQQILGAFHMTKDFLHFTGGHWERTKGLNK